MYARLPEVPLPPDGTYRRTCSAIQLSPCESRGSGGDPPEPGLKRGRVLHLIMDGMYMHAALDLEEHEHGHEMIRRWCARARDARIQGRLAYRFARCPKVIENRCVQCLVNRHPTLPCAPDAYTNSVPPRCVIIPP